MVLRFSATGQKILEWVGGLGRLGHADARAIVNMASIHGTVAAIGNSAYTAAKHGVVGLTKNAAAEYGPQGLRINCVGPAYIDTTLVTGSYYHR